MHLSRTTLHGAWALPLLAGIAVAEFKAVNANTVVDLSPTVPASK